MRSNLKYSPRNIDPTLMIDIIEALRSVSGYGSVEIYVQNNKVMQITTRNIRKTDYQLKGNIAG